jgi:hypothetical protein
LWRQVETLVAAKRQAEYPDAVRLLTNLRDLAARQQTAQGFEARLIDLRARNSKKAGSWTCSTGRACGLTQLPDSWVNHGRTVPGRSTSLL